MATATRPRTTLADMLPGERVRDAVVVVLGAVLTGLAAQVSFHIPGTPVPVTGQTFAVLLTGAALGFGRAALSMLLYMAAGIAGVPWYANHGSGFGGPAFGYVVAFIGAAALVGWLAERGGDRTVARTGLGVYEILTFPLPPYHPIFTRHFTPNPAYPDNFAPGLMADPMFDTDTYVGFTGGDVLPMVPNSRFKVFDSY